MNDLHDLAAAYVLGTLSAAKRHDVEQSLPLDAELRTAVQNWQERLLPLAALAQPVEPSEQLWQRIETTLAKSSVQSEKLPVRHVQPALDSWWNSVKLWQGMAGTGLAAAAVMAAVLVTRIGMSPVAAPQYLVVLVAPQDKAPGWVVQASSPQQLSLIPLGPMQVPAEKSLQFWTKGDNWSGPVSLGLVKPGQTIHIPLDKLPPLQPNQLFELTLEPVNGSPIDKPTGPIQFIGRAVKVI